MSGGRRGMLPPESADHYLRLPDARIVATAALIEARENLRQAIDARAMVCLYGAAGNGKSLSVNAVLRDLAPLQTHRITFRARPHPRDVRYELFRALRLPGRPPHHPVEFDLLLTETLAQRPRVLVCDEAQWMSRECFEYWRYLWDDQDTDITVVFVGGDGASRVLGREPMLASRVFVWQQFTPLTPDEVQAIIPAFHPLWQDADPALITEVDQQAAHGNFRAWARITRHALTGLVAQGRTRVDGTLLRQVYAKLGPAR